ncbi:MAG: hypothetical protein L0271_00420, partial [Gemmatimonadetes bacterium]|nr:hypothetical protein [Gemmatimonadota bacterium]
MQSGRARDHREPQLDAIFGGHDDALTGGTQQRCVRGANRNHRIDGGSAPVLDENGQIEAVALIQEARWHGAHHERQPGRQRSLAGADATV